MLFQLQYRIRDTVTCHNCTALSSDGDLKHQQNLGYIDCHLLLQVYTYEGLCEQFVYQKPITPLAVDSSMQSKLPRQIPWLKPNPVSMATPQERFTQQFFLANRTGKTIWPKLQS